MRACNAAFWVRSSAIIASIDAGLLGSGATVSREILICRWSHRELDYAPVRESSADQRPASWPVTVDQALRYGRGSRPGHASRATRQRLHTESCSVFGEMAAKTRAGRAFCKRCGGNTWRHGAVL
jgi:hypothetical protein